MSDGVLITDALCQSVVIFFPSRLVFLPEFFLSLLGTDACDVSGDRENIGREICEGHVRLEGVFLSNTFVDSFQNAFGVLGMKLQRRAFHSDRHIRVCKRHAVKLHRINQN